MTKENETNSQPTTATEPDQDKVDSPGEAAPDAEVPQNGETSAEATAEEPTEAVSAEKPTEATAEKPTEAASDEKAGEEIADAVSTETKEDTGTPDATEKKEDAGAQDAPRQDRRDDPAKRDRRRDDRRDDRRGGGGRRGDRPLTNEEKLRLYKKQSEQRLLDIKRSREAKVGKKKK